MPCVAKTPNSAVVLRPMTACTAIRRVQPNPTLSPILKPPFYAFPIHGGDIGTNGGIVTDENARVLDREDRPIGGLYAVGNNAASVMGESYPGAGATLGPAMTFGYLAGRHVMGVNAPRIRHARGR